MITASGRWVIPDGRAIFHHGKKMGPLMASPSTSDIAAGMCRVTRFAGAIWCPLSAHSLLVAQLHARLFASPSPLAWAQGLLHDAHEVVTGEVVNDHKHKELKKEQSNLDMHIYSMMGVTMPDAAELHQADMLALDIEALLLRLKGWELYKAALGVHIPEVPLKMRQDAVRYALWLHDDSPWAGAAQIYPGSQGERLLAKILGYVKRGWYQKARKLAEAKPRTELIY